MSDRPTPETDAVKFRIADSNHFAVHVIYARKLERERDEAREAAAKWEAVALREASINGARICGKEAAK